MKILELQVDFLVPVWRRVAVVVVCFGWAIVEFVSRSPFWGMIFAGLGGYALWQLFLDGWPENDKNNASDSQSAGDDEAVD